MATVILTIYVVPEANGKWAVHGYYPGECLGHFLKRDDAIAAARNYAKDNHCQFVVKQDTNTIDFAEDYASVED